MRISDWSSGVCSTDLFRPQLPDAVERLRFRVRFRGSLVEVDIGRVDTTYRLVDGPPLEVSHAGEPLALAPDSPASQSGRSSCRDRVCQYVKISVVVVSFKNKKNNKNSTNTLTQ